MADSPNPLLLQAKARLDLIIKKSRSDLYKPIQIAEVLYHSRMGTPGVDITQFDTYRLPSIRWRDNISRKLLGKVSTSSAQFQHNVWGENAIYPAILAHLDQENKTTHGAVEKYIYLSFQSRQDTVTGIIALLEDAKPATFRLNDLLERFRSIPGLRRSIDKAYEIIVYSLMETLIVTLEAAITITIPNEKAGLTTEFEDLTRVLLGLEKGKTSFSTAAHVYRVGVTNAADRGLDMWANFGPAIQVKHMTLDPELAREIVRKVESDSVLIVCRDAEQRVIKTILSQLDYSDRIRGIITDNDLIEWYERCLRGQYANLLAAQLLTRLLTEFKREFPQSAGILDFLEERGYTNLKSPEMWQVIL